MFRRINSLFVSTLVVVISAASLAGCGGNSVSESDFDLTKIQRLSHDATEERQNALEKFYNGCESAKIIRDDDTMPEKDFCLIFQGASDEVTVEKVIDILEQRDIKATFAITAAAAAEDDALISLINEKGHDIIDNGLNGNSSVDFLTDEDMVAGFSDSRKVFSTLMDIAPNKMMLNTTYYNDTMCMAAYAAGYEKLVSPSAGSYLNERSFKDQQNTWEYIARQKTGKIIVFKLDKYVEAIELEPKQEAKDPAIDKQADVELTEDKKEEDERDIITTIGWFLDAMKEQNVGNVKLDALKAVDDEEYVRQLFEDTDGFSAEVYETIETMDEVTGLCFYGITGNLNKIDDIIKTLKDEKANATFFVSAQEIEEHPDVVGKIVDAGFPIATRGATGAKLSDKDSYEIYVDLKTGVRTIQKNYGLKAKYFMPVDAGDVTENVRIAAKVAGLEIVSPGPEAFTEQGYISCFNLTKDFEIEELNKYIASAKVKDREIIDVTALVRSAACEKVTDENILKRTREANEGKLAYERDFVYTSEKAMTMTFYGISNTAVLKDVLASLSANGYRGTFFVTADELSYCKDSIEKIVKAGNEIGIACNPKEGEEYNDIAGYILGAQKYALWKYGAKISLALQPYGTVSDVTKEAVSSCGCSLAGREFSMVQSKDKDATDLSFYEPMAKKIDAHRGSVVYFNMNYYTADIEENKGEGKTLLGQLLDKFIETKVYALTYKDVNGRLQPSTSYTVKTFGELASSRYVYYPRGNSQGIIYSGKKVLGSMGDEAAQNAYMAAHYVGNPDVTVIPGFGASALKSFDKTGRITNDKVIFLTFDDWGYESDINQLLYVLDKYKVKGNFFVRTNNVSNNPNLLRAIAMEGHMIGSHSDSHITAWHSNKNNDGSYTYESISEKEAQRLRNDVIKSYTTLNKYCGDVVVNGKKSLSTIYRPPTLAVSRLGMYNIFDVGYTHIVSGSLSTADYNCKSVDELVDILRNGRSSWYGKEKVGNGSCIVMHMSAEAKYTAEALDIMIPEWKAQGYTIARLDDYLK